MPRVSVIIPVYGVEKYIERCARSLFGQTLDDIEFLFIDDCTPDKSIDKLKQVLEEYPHRKNQVTIHRMEHNSGQAKVREWGMLNVTGEYVIHCDSDDWVDLDTYEILLNKAINSNTDIVFFDYFLEYENGYSINYKRNVPTNNKVKLIEKMLSGFYDANPLWGAFVKRSIYENIIYPNGNQGEDSVIMMQTIYNSNKMEYLPMPKYHYFINCQSITRNPNINCVMNRVTQGIENVKTVEAFLEKYNLSKMFEKQLVVYKFKIRLFLWSYLNRKECYLLWKNLFPEINNFIICNKYLPIRYKIYELSYRLRISPIVKRLL